MTPHFLKWSFGPKIESVDGICQQTDSRNRFYLDVKTGPNPLIRWDVSSIPANGIFLTKKLKNKNKNAQRVEND